MRTRYLRHKNNHIRIEKWGVVQASLITADEIREKQVLPRPIRYVQDREAQQTPWGFYLILLFLAIRRARSSWSLCVVQKLTTRKGMTDHIKSGLIGMLSTPSTPIWQKRMRRKFTTISICWNLVCSMCSAAMPTVDSLIVIHATWT